MNDENTSYNLPTYAMDSYGPAFRPIDPLKDRTIPLSLAEAIFKGRKVIPRQSQRVEAKELDELHEKAWVDADLNREFNLTAPGYAKRCVKLKKIRTRARREIARQVRAAMESH